MVKETPTWAVVATIDEPPALVQAFVAWHLSLGAAQIFLYCDRPRDAVQARLVHLPQVTVVPCDAAHWRRLGKSRPRRHQVRQVRNARDAYTRTTADWILHCDADEFVRAGVPVSDALRDVPAETACLLLHVAERVHPLGEMGAHIFDGAFRRPFRVPQKRGVALFGADYALTYRGLTGHSQGKAFVRTGRSLHMSIHRPRPATADQEVFSARATIEAMELLHFEGLTQNYWAYKLARMVHALQERDGMPPSDHRRRQADELIAAPSAAAALYQRLKCPDAQAIAQLRKRGLWDDRVFDPSQAVARYFPDQIADPSLQNVDRWLNRHKKRVADYLLK